MKIKLKFEWIPGHTDNKFNDIVDKLAKEAANSWLPPTNISPPSPPPLFFSYTVSTVIFFLY